MGGNDVTNAPPGSCPLLDFCFLSAATELASGAQTGVAAAALLMMPASSNPCLLQEQLDYQAKIVKPGRRPTKKMDPMGAPGPGRVEALVHCHVPTICLFLWQAVPSRLLLPVALHHAPGLLTVIPCRRTQHAAQQAHQAVLR